MQTVRQRQTLFGNRSTGVEPSMAVIALFHTSANSDFTGMNIGFLFSSYFQILHVVFGSWVLSLYFSSKIDDKFFLILHKRSRVTYSLTDLKISSISHLRWSPLVDRAYGRRLLKRLQIERSWSEACDLPDGTLCVQFFFWQSDPPEYWDERPAWGFLWGESVKFLGVSVFCLTLRIALDVQPLTADSAL